MPEQDSRLFAAPAPLTAGERRALIVLTLLIAVTRWLAEAATLWDWDEALFCSGVYDYDVASHHPHPPGFPLFIAAAKLIHMAGVGEFRSLQIVTFIGAVALFPVMVMLCRELQLTFLTSVTAALVLVFLPNVWLFGGTGFSDVPSLTLSVLAVALLLRSCHDGSWLVPASIVLALASAMRPQNLLIGFLPAILATIRNFRTGFLRVVVAVALGMAIVAGCFLLAAQATGGWQRYWGAIQSHQHYIVTVDSFHNPNRPSLSSLFDDFFIRPFRMPVVNVVMGLLMLIAIANAVIRRRRGVLLALGTFFPFGLFAWMMLDHLSVSRFSIAYMPLTALLTAEGIAAMVRSSRAQKIAAIAGTCVLAGLTFPAIWIVHTQPSPPMAAIDWIRRNVAPHHASILVHGSMIPYAEFLLRDYRLTILEDDAAGPPAMSGQGFLITEGILQGAGARLFKRSRERFRGMVRDRYFESTVIPYSSIVTYVEGWHEPESIGSTTWRWMGRRGVALLAPLPTRFAELTLRYYVPLDALRSVPAIRLMLNGQVVDTVSPSQAVTVKTYRVAPLQNSPNRLELETSGVVNPAAQGLSSDARDLGIRIEEIRWSPAPSP